jgi:succinyl-CoA synthetase alpha subunit
MAILVTKKSRVVVQGITGRAGTFHTRQMLDCGTSVVAGVSPGKGGEAVHGVPVYDTVRESVQRHDADVSVLFLPARFVLESTVEAIRAGIKLVVVVPEHIPIHDMLRIRKHAQDSGALVIGGNTAGIISPEEANVGIIPPIAFKKGCVGVASRSGSMTYYVADTLTRSGYGESTCVGLGGDPILGATFVEILPLFDEDPETRAVVLVGEIGGVYEEAAAETIRAMKKPVLAMVGGRYAPPGKRMGHAGAIIEGEMGTAQSKLKALKDARAITVSTFTEIPRVLEARIGKPQLSES